MSKHRPKVDDIAKPPAQSIYLLMLLPVLLWLLFFLGVIGIGNPAYSTMVVLGARVTIWKILMLLLLTVLPAIAAFRALNQFAAMRRHHRRDPATLRIFAIGIAGIVLALWAVMLFVMSREA